MDAAERHAVAALLVDSLSGLRAEAAAERYRWSHEENPAGPAETIVARHGTPEIVIGCASVYPRRLRAGGRDLLAAIPADFAVQRAHRFGGVAVALQRALLEHGSGRFPLIIAFPNRAALAVMRRVGFKPIATAMAWVKPLRAAYKIEQHVGVGWLARVVSMPADFALAAVDAWRLGRRSTTTSEVVDRADARFDRLWAGARDRYAAVGERTAGYLNWRYRAGPNGHRFFCLLDTAGELIGYTAFHVTERKVFVDDLFTTDMDGAADRLILLFVREMRRAGHQSICVVYAGNAGFAGRLRALGFIARPATARVLIGVAQPGLEHLLERDTWFLFEGEMDV